LDNCEELVDSGVSGPLLVAFTSLPPIRHTVSSISN